MRFRRAMLGFVAAAGLGLFAWSAVTSGGQGAGTAPKQSAGQEKSVKPGINDTWKSPNVEPLVEMLESESREIYHEREKLAALVGPPPGAAIADVGAGSGFMTELFAGLVGPGGKVYAVDINPKLLERIAGHAREKGMKNIETVLARDDSSELPANSVDLVFICDTYHHFEYPAQTMASLHRALRPGGQLVLVDFRRIPGVSAEWMFNHVRAGQEVFTREILDAGFELVNVHNVPYFKENYVLRFRKVEKPHAMGLRLDLPMDRSADLRFSAPA